MNQDNQVTARFQLDAVITKINIDGSISKIKQSIAVLEQLKEIYQTEKEKLEGQVLTELFALAAAAGLDHDIKSVIIRRLYWDEGLSFQLIAKAFAISIAKTRELAGEFIYHHNCLNKCGNLVERKFENKIARDQYLKHFNQIKKRPFESEMLCGACRQQQENKYINYLQTQRDARIARNAFLSAL